MAYVKNIPGRVVLSHQYDILEIPQNLEEWGVCDALEEQDCIGWYNFFKAHILEKLGKIQMNANRVDDRLESIPGHYSATWWTAGLIKEMIHFSLNMWQH